MPGRAGDHEAPQPHSKKNTSVGPKRSGLFHPSPSPRSTLAQEPERQTDQAGSVRTGLSQTVLYWGQRSPTRPRGHTGRTGPVRSGPGRAGPGATNHPSLRTKKLHRPARAGPRRLGPGPRTTPVPDTQEGTPVTPGQAAPGRAGPDRLVPARTKVGRAGHHEPPQPRQPKWSHRPGSAGPGRSGSGCGPRTIPALEPKWDTGEAGPARSRPDWTGPAQAGLETTNLSSPTMKRAQRPGRAGPGRVRPGLGP